jgi:hypothetical protein
MGRCWFHVASRVRNVASIHSEAVQIRQADFRTVYSLNPFGLVEVMTKAGRNSKRETKNAVSLPLNHGCFPFVFGRQP